MFMNKIILFRVVNDEEFVLFFFSFDFVFLIFILFYILDLGKEYNIMLYIMVISYKVWYKCYTCHCHILYNHII